MSAKVMYNCLNVSPPDFDPAHPGEGKEKHKGNSRKELARMKVKARRVERHKAESEAKRLLDLE